MMTYHAALVSIVQSLVEAVHKLAAEGRLEWLCERMIAAVHLLFSDYWAPVVATQVVSDEGLEKAIGNSAFGSGNTGRLLRVGTFCGGEMICDRPCCIGVICCPVGCEYTGPSWEYVCGRCRYMVTGR